MRPRPKNTGTESKARASKLLVLLLCLLLTACGREAQEPVLELPDLPNAPESPRNPEKTSGWSSTAENLYSLDVTLIFGEIEQILASEDKALIFARSETGITLYPYGLENGMPASEPLPLGDILWYPTEPLADGTLPLVRSEGEPGQWQTVLFLDPADLSVQTMHIPRPGSYYGLHFSPDRQYAALSTFDGLQVLDGATMTQLLLAVPVVYEETADHAERQTVWAETWHSGTVLTARLAEPDLVRCPVIIDMVDKSVTHVTELDLCQGRFLEDGRMLWHNYFRFAPAGSYDLKTEKRTELVFLDTLHSDVMSCIALSRDSVALSYIVKEQDTPKDAWISVMTLNRGFTVARASLPLAGRYGAFEQLSFTPDGTTLLALFDPDQGPKQVLRLPLS